MMHYTPKYLRGFGKVYYDEGSDQYVPSVSMVCDQVTQAPYLQRQTGDCGMGSDRYKLAGTVCHSVMPDLFAHAMACDYDEWLRNPKAAKERIREQIEQHPDMWGAYGNAGQLTDMCLSASEQAAERLRDSMEVAATEAGYTYSGCGFDAYCGMPDVILADRKEEIVGGVLDWKFSFSEKVLCKSSCVRPEHEVAAQCYLMLIEPSTQTTPDARRYAAYVYTNIKGESYLHKFFPDQKIRGLIIAAVTLLRHRLRSDLETYFREEERYGRAR